MAELGYHPYDEYAQPEYPDPMGHMNSPYVVDDRRLAPPGMHDDYNMEDRDRQRRRDRFVFLTAV